jgi:maltose alpha-D-glucosyltransferase/alpha-amylase
VFLRNHDELTLEMVTDEDRDYMYRVYAEDPQARINLGIRRRLAPLMGERRRVELMTALLLSMPGTPVLYYGDEIGMGDNMWLGDRDGVRTPMQWSGDRCAGFSTTNPQRLYLPTVIDPEFHYTTVNVETQQRNPASLLWWNRRMLALRRRYAAFGRGDIRFVKGDNGRVLAFTRTWHWQTLLVVANLARTPQRVALDLSEHAGLVPVELTGQQAWPALDEHPLVLTLGPHGCYWFCLERSATPRVAPHEPPDVGELARLDRICDTPAELQVELALATWLPERRWFRAHGRPVRSLRIVQEVPVDGPDGGVLLLVKVEDADGRTDTYSVPLAFLCGEDVVRVEADRPGAVIARARVGDCDGVLVDGMQAASFTESLLQGLLRRRREARGEGEPVLAFTPTRGLAGRLRGHDLAPQLGALEQSNHSVLYGDRVILKLLRVVEPGVHPEEELGRRLSSQLGFPHVPRLEGTVTLLSGGTSSLLAVAHELLPAQADVWTMTLDAIGAFLERAHASPAPPPPYPGGVVDRARLPIPAPLAELFGPYLTLVRQLGHRTAELHRALATPTDDPAFAPEPLSVLHLRGMYQAARTMTQQTLDRLERQVDELDPRSAVFARELLARRDELDQRLRRVFHHKVDAVRTRVHGDLHLGQVLYTNRDFVFLDFEGEPLRPLGERRLKRSPLRDVAGLVRSLRYATGAMIREGRVREQANDGVRPWLDAWGDWTTAALVGAWLDGVAGTKLAPTDHEDLSVLLDYHLLDKCVYEIAYELDHRPDWLAIPLRGLVTMLDR